MYEAANLKLVNHRVPAMGYLRGAWLRSPLDLSFSFASEQAVDQLVYLLQLDPLEFRLKNLKDERLRAVLQAAAKQFGWGGIKAAAGHGFGIAGGSEKGSYVATCAEVSVDRSNGKVNVVRAVTAF